MYCESYLTVYNRHTDTETDNVTFHRTVLKCHWEETTGKTSASDQKTSRKSDAFIPVINITTKTYLEPEEYAMLTSEEADSYFTFAPEDIIYHMPMADEIEQNGLRSFLREHPGQFAVLTAAFNNFGSQRMRHWEVHCEE